MHDTRDERALAGEVQLLMAEGDARDMKALRLLAERRDTFAIDAGGRVAYLVNAATGRCHVMHARAGRLMTPPEAAAEPLEGMGE